MASRPTATVPQTPLARCADGADRIVDVQFQVKQFHNDYNEDTRHRADYDRPGGVQRVTAGGNSHKAGKRSIEAHGYVRLPVLPR